MRTLFPHQQQLLDRLLGDPPPTLLIRSRVGLGLTEVLVQLAARRSQAGDLVVVVLPHGALADQWIHRLQDAGTQSVRALRKSSELLLILDSAEEPELPRSGVVIVTARLLGRIVGNRALDNISPSLVIVSDLAATEHSQQAVAVMRLIRRANQAIVTVHTSEQARWFTASETVEWTLDVLTDSVRDTRSVRLLTYAPSQQELADQYHAAALLAEVTGELPLRAATRPALHASLLRAAARLAGDPLDAVQDGDLELDKAGGSPRPGLEDDLWKAAEALEILDRDGRLDAVAQLVEEAAAGRRPCLITTDRVDEADYVASHLHTLGRTVAVVTGSTTRSERGSAIEKLASGGIVVGSQILYDLLDQLPDRTLNVWWSPPWTPADAEKRLGVGPMSEGVETVVILSEPPLPADRLFRTLMGLQQTDPPG